jgi:multisubunit Na+/H+ antiporter MnhF subunit
MAVLILPAVATGISPIIDVALMLALLAAFAAAAFVRGMSDPEPEK